MYRNTIYIREYVTTNLLSSGIMLLSSIARGVGGTTTVACFRSVSCFPRAIVIARTPFLVAFICGWPTHKYVRAYRITSRCVAYDGLCTVL